MLRWLVTWAVKEFTKARKGREQSLYSLDKKGEGHGVERYTSIEGRGL